MAYPQASTSIFVDLSLEELRDLLKRAEKSETAFIQLRVYLDHVAPDEDARFRVTVYDYKDEVLISEH